MKPGPEHDLDVPLWSDNRGLFCTSNFKRVCYFERVSGVKVHKL